ncbi:MAG: CoA transferase, partial [Rhizobiales bacterium]|nr:CoA transferase [Hyphomicrobiales bacterium]
VAIFKRMAAKADVIVENYRPSVKHRLGIDYETLRRDNRGLIYASISGFGQDGPLADRPGFDQILQGMGGLMSITGEPGQGPMRVGIPIADLCSGLLASQGIMLALLKRERTGEGQWVQCSLLQAQAFMLDFQAARWLMDGDVPGQAGNDHPTSIPTGVFKTSDGYINIAASGGTMWERLRDHMGDQRLHADKFASAEARSDNRKALNAILNECTAQKTSAHWVETLNGVGVPCGEINTIDKVFENPQMQHLGMAWDVDSQERGKSKLVGQPITLSGSKASITAPPPTIGQHTREVLGEFGYGASEIDEFEAAGVI